ncbi:MAG: hypothetical protein IPG73_09995 [Ignavibacteria bacterium]|nr:hypothetical protein [Ignavibacteria bacterium]
MIILPNPSPVKAQAPSGSAKLNVYPNPATSSVTVDLPPDLPPDASLTVLNITGSALIQQPIRDIGTMQVDVSRTRRRFLSRPDPNDEGCEFCRVCGEEMTSLASLVMTL